MVYPQESEWFGIVDKDGVTKTMEETEFYKQDILGLKTLNEANKIVKV